MRRLAAMLLMFVLTACGGGEVAPGPHDTPPPPKPAATRKGSSLSCGDTRIRFPAMPEGLVRAGSFTRLGSLTRRLTVRGVVWQESMERVYLGVVCGVRSAEQFATLVAGSRLTVYQGEPALRWTTRSGLRNFMWLERPGTAIYIGTTPGLATLIKTIASGVEPTSTP
ncbi:hypothetical protein [Nonomuraea jiangxiensis]|uniref:Lipoprotein n=1 Tax=Nonomuraea jiangxiensis TaxID=633440 RepID=A0A1G9U1E0_9ACTN|nr:hypothetical protein [Nonomuraea jiangxiensis]SDM53355.1 hypothetical protein SAMN05421869_14663 [Nonomuraea jiangxiensis]